MVSELPNQMSFVSMEITLASKERKVESTRSVFQFLYTVGSLVFSFPFCANSIRCQHSALVFCQLYRNYIYTLHSQCFIASVAWKTVAWCLREGPVSVCGSG